MGETDRDYCLRMAKEHPECLEHLSQLLKPEHLRPVHMTAAEYERETAKAWHEAAACLRSALAEAAPAGR